MPMPRLCASAMMLLSAFTGLLTMAGLATGVMNAQDPPQAGSQPFTIGGPYTHDNLAVYVIRGDGGRYARVPHAG